VCIANQQVLRFQSIDMWSIKPTEEEMEDKTKKRPGTLAIALTTLAIAAIFGAILGTAIYCAPPKLASIPGMADVTTETFAWEVLSSRVPVYLEFYTLT
jgi:hypothetical protein